MENTEYISKFKKADCYAITQKLRNSLNGDFDLVIKRRKENGCLEFEFTDSIFSDKDFTLEVAFLDNACLIMNYSGDVPFDAGQIYEIFTEYCKERFGPEYVTYLHDTAITY